MNRRGRPTPSLAAKLALAVASAVLTLAGGELAVGLFFPPPTRVMTDFRLLTSGYYERHEVVGWLPRRNVAGVHTKPGSFATTFRTNSHGLRDREHPLEKPPSGTRIVVVGDSFTWGYGVNDDKVYPRVLEPLLEGVEVINLGVTAFGTKQEFDYLKLEGLRYGPDIVILGFCLNDIYPDTESVQAAAPAATGAALNRAKRWLSEHAALYELARQAANTNKTVVKLLVRLGVKDSLSGFEELDVNLMPALRVYPDRLRRSFEQTRAELLEIHRFLAERRIRFVLVLIPSLQSIDARALRQSIAYSLYDEADFDLEKPYRLLEAFARAHEIEVVNPYRALKRLHEAGVPLYLKRDIHFNPAGHRALADEIAAYLTAGRAPRP